MEERILFVDDDPNILEGYERKLQSVLRVHTALGPHLALREIQERGPFAVVVADMCMPLMNGVEFLARVREIAPETVRMMLTGNADIKVAMDAVNSGNVFRFLTKPCPSKLMGDSLVAGIKQYRLVVAEKEVLEGTLNGIVELLVEILSWVNPDAFGRALQLRALVRDIAARLKAPNAWEIEVAAALSQVGSMALPQEVAKKAAGGERLETHEQRMLGGIPATGRDLLHHIPRLENVAHIVLYQHKQYDGRGFPDDSISEKRIPLGARILKVAIDLLDLCASGSSRVEALGEMERRQGWYDPHILVAANQAARQQLRGAAKTTAVSFSGLRPGHVLAADILTADARKLVTSGTQVTEALLIRLHKFSTLKGLMEPITVCASGEPKNVSAGENRVLPAS